MENGSVRNYFKILKWGNNNNEKKWGKIRNLKLHAQNGHASHAVGMELFWRGAHIQIKKKETTVVFVFWLFAKNHLVLEFRLFVFFYFFMTYYKLFTK